jgi:hypothetical protein
MMGIIEESLARHRRNCALRFTGATEWLRLVLLGLLIITSSAIGLADILATVPLPGHFGEVQPYAPV